METLQLSYEELDNCVTDIEDIFLRLCAVGEKMDELLQSFLQSYEGEAYEEVKLFLKSLPDHIYRLVTLYSIMRKFIVCVKASISTSDEVMSYRMH